MHPSNRCRYTLHPARKSRYATLSSPLGYFILFFFIIFSLLFFLFFWDSFFFLPSFLFCSCSSSLYVSVRCSHVFCDLPVRVRHFSVTLHLFLLIFNLPARIYSCLCISFRYLSPFPLSHSFYLIFFLFIYQRLSFSSPVSFYVTF